MTPRKLTDSDIQDILHLYRQTGETTSTLAGRYGVSNTTISRLLKSQLSEPEYEMLIQQKRAARTSVEASPAESIAPVASLPSAASEPLAEAAPLPKIAPPKLRATAASLPPKEEVKPTEEVKPVLTAASSASQDTPRKRSRKRSEVTFESIAEAQLELDAALAQLSVPIKSVAEAKPEETVAFAQDLMDDVRRDQAADLLDLEDEDEDLEDEDEDDLDADLDDVGESDEDEDEAPDLRSLHIRAESLVKVLPLADATIPRPCYLVVDRTAELVARPLREFADLGQIPTEEIQAKTLPVFDNHRVAKRFSNHRTQRVIKVPDGRVLQKTSSHLQAKGITRLLIDGQVYAL
jgi:hypothetical protein